MKIKDIISTIKYPFEGWDVIEVDGDLPRTMLEFVEAWHEPKETWANDTFPDDIEKEINGDYECLTVDYEEFDRYFCDGCCPTELKDTFPRVIIAIESQGG